MTEKILEDFDSTDENFKSMASSPALCGCLQFFKRILVKDKVKVYSIILITMHQCIHAIIKQQNK